MTEAEGYRITVTQKKVTIEGQTPQGVFYGVQTLRKSLAGVEGEAVLPAAVIEDAPRFGYRGMHLDVARHFFGVETKNASDWNPRARTEGGDIHIASDDLLVVGEGIRTNAKGIEFLAQTFAHERKNYHILVQELPREPESFIHLDMVFTFLSSHQCLVFEPLVRKQGLFEGKDTTLITIDNGKISQADAETLQQWHSDPENWTPAGIDAVD